MNAVRRWNARRRAPSFRAIADAGPPLAWVIVGGIASLPAVAGLELAGVRDVTTLLAVPFISFVIVCVLDRDGWRIRMGTAELASLQRQRWVLGRLPTDPLSAEAWLGAHPDAPLVDRAATLVTAGRNREARDLIEGAVGGTPEEAIRLARMRLTIAASLDETALDRRAIEAFERLPELAALPDAERRYHRLSLAWSTAWIDIHAGRRWRPALAAALRDLGPFRPPARYAAFHVVYQFALPMAYLLVLLIASWLGLVPVSR